MANHSGELLLGRDAIVAPSIAERIRDKAAAIIEASGSGGGDGGFSGDEAAVVDDAASRRRVAMFLAVVAPLLFVAAIIASAALVGEPSRDDVAAAKRAVAGDVLQQPAAATPIQASGGAIVPPAGAQLTSMALDGERIALHFRGDNSEEIIIYDLATGAPAARLPMRAAEPAATAMAFEPLASDLQSASLAIEPPAPSRKPLATD